MNNCCPSCGALYNVAPKDVGRRLRCKKCSSSLKVADSGLELDSSDTPPDEAGPPEVAHEEHGGSDSTSTPRPRARRHWTEERNSGVSLIDRLGGLPTALFGAGIFLVVVSISFPIIGRAAGERATAYKNRLENDREQEKFDLRPRKPRNEWSDAERQRVEEETPKIEAKYARLIERAELDAQSTKIANIRDAWFEAYGLMFGFLLLCFGCIGYLRTEPTLVLKIVAATILTFIVLAFLAKFTGCGSPRIEADAGASAPYPKAK